MTYAIIYEPTATGYSAYVPDLPGCIATGRTLGQTRDRMQEAVKFHVASMREDGEPVPESITVADMIEIAGPRPPLPK